MYRLPAFKGVAHQKGYGVSYIFKGLAKTFAPIVKKDLLNFGKQALQSGVQVLDDISQEKDVKVAMKRHAIGSGKKIGKRSINRAPSSKTTSCKRTDTGRRLIATKKKRVSADL